MSKVHVYTFCFFSRQELSILYRVYTGQPKAQYFFTNKSICTTFCFVCVCACVCVSFFTILFPFGSPRCGFLLSYLHFTGPEHGGAAVPRSHGVSLCLSMRCSVFPFSRTWHNEVVVLLNNRVLWRDSKCDAFAATAANPSLAGRRGGSRLLVNVSPSLGRFEPRLGWRIICSVKYRNPKTQIIPLLTVWPSPWKTKEKKRKKKAQQLPSVSFSVFTCAAESTTGHFRVTFYLKTCLLISNASFISTV